MKNNIVYVSYFVCLFVFFARMDEFSVEVHHGGKFLSDPIRYEGVAINYFDGNERDCWSA